MPRETIKIRKTKKAPYESCAHFFSILAYPEGDNSFQREVFFQALCRWAIERRMEIDPDWAKTYQWIAPAIFSGEDHKAVLIRGSKILYKRLVVCKYMLSSHLSAMDSGVPAFVEGYFPSVLNMSILTGHRLGWKGEDSSATVKSKIWAPARPVAHLAAGWLWWTSIWSECLGDRTPDFDPYIDCFFNPWMVEEVVGLCERVRLMLPTIKHFRKLGDDSLIRVTI